MKFHGRSIEDVLTELQTERLFRHFDDCMKCDSYGTCHVGLAMIENLVGTRNVSTSVERVAA